MRKVPAFDTAAADAFNDRTLGLDALYAADFGLMLAQLVAYYQAEHGLVVDGKLGPATMASLRAPATMVTEPAPYFVPVGARARSIDRARKAADEQCYYDLGAGGSKRDPAWPTWPWNEKRQCDCSAFTCWCLEFPRNDGDWNTTKVLRDAIKRDGTRGPETRFRKRNRPGDVRPGDVIVKDGIFDPKTGLRTKPGHIGNIIAIDPDFDWDDPNWWMKVMIAHCSPANSAPPPKGRGLGHAIGITDGTAWRNARDLDFDGDIDDADNVAWWASNNIAIVNYIPFGEA